MRSQKILIVEDNPDAAESLRLMFVERGPFSPAACLGLSSQSTSEFEITLQPAFHGWTACCGELMQQRPPRLGKS
jgi:hypothetical protein